MLGAHLSISGGLYNALLRAKELDLQTVQIFTNNQGTIENVVVRSSDPGKAGFAGIALAQNWPGPALLRHVRVDGCDFGIWSIIHQYSFTFEHLSLENQLKAGIFNKGQKLFIRGLTSRSKAPAIESRVVPSFATFPCQMERSTATSPRGQPK